VTSEFPKSGESIGRLQVKEWGQKGAPDVVLEAVLAPLIIGIFEGAHRNCQVNDETKALRRAKTVDVLNRGDPDICQFRLMKSRDRVRVLLQNLVHRGGARLTIICDARYARDAMTAVAPMISPIAPAASQFTVLAPCTPPNYY